MNCCKSPNVIELSKFDAVKYYNKMICTPAGEHESIDKLINAIDETLTQLGKFVYPSHIDFKLLGHGRLNGDESNVYVQIIRYDGEKGIIPDELAEAAGTPSAKIVTLYTATTAERIPKGGYYFEKIDENNDVVIKYLVETSNHKKSRLTTLEELEGFYLQLSKMVRIASTHPELIEKIRGNHMVGYSRDGYL